MTLCLGGSRTKKLLCVAWELGQYNSYHPFLGVYLVMTNPLNVNAYDVCETLTKQVTYNN